jgi:hypothetical protein
MLKRSIYDAMVFADFGFLTVSEYLLEVGFGYFFDVGSFVEVYLAEFVLGIPVCDTAAHRSHLVRFITLVLTLGSTVYLEV